MADKLRVELVELTRMANHVLTGSQQVGDGLRGAAAVCRPPREAFGDVAAAGTIHDELHGAYEDAGLAIGRLVGVLEGDVDRLYRVAFAMQWQDDANAAAMRDPRGGPQAW